MKIFTHARCTFALIFALSILAIAFAMYLELSMGLKPCPLCVMQRIAVIGIAIISLIAFLHGARKWGFRVYGLLILAMAIFGIAFATRQLWLQSLPAGTAPACGAGIGYMFQNLPFSKFLLDVFQGSGECAVVHWQFLGKSLAFWSEVYFCIMLLMSVWQLCRKCCKNTQVD